MDTFGNSQVLTQIPLNRTIPGEKKAGLATGSPSPRKSAAPSFVIFEG
jgi:hypothetical protein